MKIRDILNQGKPVISFEVFPPKLESGYDSVKNAVSTLCKQKPAFMSVTYGASGDGGSLTSDIASYVQNDCKITALAHLTCLMSNRDGIRSTLQVLKKKNIENILALRGDKPVDTSKIAGLDFKYASELVTEIKKNGDFCIGAACYPDGHVECERMEDDINNLKKKVDAGVDFLTTQMFFDNNVLYRFLYNIREKGIYVPVIAGIMPVTNVKQITRICKLSGTYLPQRFKSILDKFGCDPRMMAQAGIAYATEQIIDLWANGVNAVHIYTMNKPEIAEGIMRNVSSIVGES